MKKRFTDVEKWDDPWFVSLEPKSKLFWIWLLDNVDQAGVWEKFEKKYQFETGIGIGLEAMLEDLGDRIDDLGDKILIPKFVKFQYGSELSESSNYHRGIIKLLEKHGLSMDDQGLVKGKPRVDQGLTKGKPRVGQGLSNPKLRVLYKDKDKDKDIKGDARGKNEPEFPFTDKSFEEAWRNYLQMRRDAKFKKLGKVAISAKFKEFKEWGIEMSVEALENSVKMQWQGVFYPEQKNGHKPKQKIDRSYSDPLKL